MVAQKPLVTLKLKGRTQKVHNWIFQKEEGKKRKKISAFLRRGKWPPVWKEPFLPPDPQENEG